MNQYGRPWARESVERARLTRDRERQGALMKATLERVFSGAGLVFNERRATMYPGTGTFTAREVEFQGLTLSLEGKIEQAVPKFTSVNIRGGATNVKVNKLVRALSMLTGQRPCPV